MSFKSEGGVKTDKKRQLDVSRPTIEETLKGFLKSEGK